MAVMAWLLTFPIPLIVFPTGPLSTVTEAIPVKLAVTFDAVFGTTARSCTPLTVNV